MKARTANKVLPKAGVIGFYDTFVLNQTLDFQINSSAETPRLRQYPNRYHNYSKNKAKCSFSKY